MNFKACLFFVFIILSTGCKNEKSSNIPTSNNHKALQKNLENYFSALTQLEKFNGCVLVEKENQQLLRKAFNITANKKNPLFVNIEDQFDIHSVSKLMANAAIIQLENEGKIKRSDFIEKYIPTFPNGDKITILHLMENRSGLPRELSSIETKSHLDPKDFVELAKQEELEFEPGTDKRYSNVGFQLLYFIIGKINDTSFEAYLRDNIFRPLKMKDSGAHFYIDKSNLKKLAQNHILEDSIVTVPNFLEEDSKQATLFSTADDLKLFLEFVEKEPFRSNLSKDKGIISWAGGSDGIRAYVHTNLDSNYKFIFLANYDAIPFNKIIETLKLILENQPFEIPKPVNRKAVEIQEEILSKYVGTYDFEEANHILLTVKLEEKVLKLFQNGEEIAILFPETKNKFFHDPKSEESFEFKQDDKGKFYALMDWKGAQFKGVKQ